jgi:hypothetical protein
MAPGSGIRLALNAFELFDLGKGRPFMFIESDAIPTPLPRRSLSRIVFKGGWGLGQRWILGSAVLAFFFLQVSGAGQEQRAEKATVHIVVVDGFGDDLGEANVASFKDSDTGQDLAGRFHENTATGIPYNVYQIRVHQVGFFTAEVTAQVFQPDVWVVIGLRYGEELPVFPAARLQLSGTIKNLDSGEQPVYLKLVGVYSDFIMETRVEATGHSGTFTLAGVIPDGKYILITLGRTKMLDVRQLDVAFPVRDPIVIDLARGNHLLPGRAGHH